MMLGNAAAARALATPLTILTGFLGAGKTTLLNRILRGGHGLRIGVLVNDFGAINIDADLVVGSEDGMVSLSNGCVCCRPRVPKLAALMDEAEADVLAYMGFPVQHRTKLHGANPIERLNHEIKRCSDASGSSPPRPRSPG